MANSKQVTIYSTPTCAFCHQAKQWFKENDVEFEDHDVSQDPEALKEMREKTGQMGVPVIEVKDKIIIGFDRHRLAELLEV